MTGDNHNCRVCGFRFDEPPWGETGRDPSYEICPCCSAEAGLDDISPELVRRLRAEWIAAGATWWADDDEPHDGLTTEERLSHVPPGYED